MEDQYQWHAQVPTQDDLDNAAPELADPEKQS